MLAEQSPSDIYARLLLPKKHGYPLWFPEPDEDLPPEYRSIGVDIGDVGTITPDGAFDFLFNICHSADDPINWLGVPDGFVPLTLQPGDVRRRSNMYAEGTHISSARICKVQLRDDEPAPGFKFECSGSTGAVLILPEGGSRVDLRKMGLFYQYSASNATAWYRFVNGPDLCRQAGNGSLYLVTGCDKSPAWGVASYSHPFGAPEGSLKFTAVGEEEDGSTSLAYGWENYSSAAVRTGRRQGRQSAAGPELIFNQCVFIRGLRISLQPQLLRRLLGDKVKVEEAFNPLHEVKNNITSSLLKSTTNSSYGKQRLKKMDSANESDVLIEHISDVSEVCPRCMTCTGR